jgi:hypothetical protein
MARSLIALLAVALAVLIGVGIRKLPRNDPRQPDARSAAPAEASSATAADRQAGAPPRVARPITLPASTLPPPAPVPPDIDEKMRETRQRTFEHLERKLRDEAADRRWAADAVPALRAEVSRAAPAGTRILDVRCAATLCRLVLAHETVDQQRQIGFVLTAGPFMHGVTFSYAPETLTTTAWVAREGSSFDVSGL